MNLIAMELQNVPPASGRGEVSQPSQPAQSGPPTGGPAGGAGGFGGMGMMLIMFVPMLLVIFLLNRSQGKKQKELESKLKKGDRVLVAGGLVGKIAELGSKYAKIEIAPGVKVQMLKTAIQGLDTGDESSTSASAKDGGKDKSESSKDENK